MIYPSVKKDSYGNFTEDKLNLVDRDHFIGRQISVTNKPHEEIQPSKKPFGVKNFARH